tara:strand:+ start:117 stop:389 length:273 start_codon:yes stop_codon:yes gene_type:complete
MTIEKERELGTCTSCKARGRIWSSKTADAYPYDTEKLCKKCSQPKILTKAFDMAWDVVKAKAKCPECKRVFDLMNEKDAQEWYHGHDCEA